MSTKVKITVIVLAVLILAPVVIPLVGIFVFPNLPGHELLLRYLSTFSTTSWWPFASIILFVFFCVLFSREISKKIATISLLDIFKVKARWSAEQPQPPTPPRPEVVPPGPPTAPVEIAKLVAVAARVAELERLIFFERTMRVMYRSQLNLLFEIKKDTSIPVWFIPNIYEKNFLGNRTMVPFDKWLGYLYKSNLVETEGSSLIRLTPLGIDFLYFARDYPVAFLPPI